MTPSRRIRHSRPSRHSLPIRRCRHCHLYAATHRHADPAADRYAAAGATAKPKSRPKPKATATPKPPPKPQPTQAPQYAWNGQVSNTFQNCGLTRVFGFTLANNGGLAGDIWVHYWADGWNGAWAKSGWTDFGSGTSWKGDEGNWDGTIDVKARDGVGIPVLYRSKEAGTAFLTR